MIIWLVLWLMIIENYDTTQLLNEIIPLNRQFTSHHEWWEWMVSWKKKPWKRWKNGWFNGDLVGFNDILVIKKDFLVRFTQGMDGNGGMGLSLITMWIFPSFPTKQWLPESIKQWVLKLYRWLEPYYHRGGWTSKIPWFIIHWLVVTGCHQFYFPIYWVSDHPNWLSYFSAGWPNHQPDMCIYI